MDNSELAEKVMGWTWKKYINKLGWAINYWYDKNGDQTDYGSGSMHLDKESPFEPLQKIAHAFLLLDFLDSAYNIEYTLTSNRRIDDVLYKCTITDYWDNRKEYQSTWFDTPTEAICDAVLSFQK